MSNQSNRKLRKERHYLLSSARQMERTAALLTQSGHQKALDQARQRRHAAAQFLLLIRGGRPAQFSQYRGPISYKINRPKHFSNTMAEEERALDAEWERVFGDEKPTTNGIIVANNPPLPDGKWIPMIFKP